MHGMRRIKPVDTRFDEGRVQRNDGILTPAEVPHQDAPLMSMSDAAKIMGISPERASQIDSQACDKFIRGLLNDPVIQRMAKGMGICEENVDANKVWALSSRRMRGRVSEQRSNP